MRGIFSLTKIAFISTCIFGLSIAQPDEFQTLNTIEEFGGKAWNQAQTVFQTTADKMKQVFHDDIEKYTIFKHESFSNYALRYRTPSICDPNVKQISGYLDIDEDKHFFFWFFESRSKPKEDPLVLWLNGGPGGSSMLGLLMELGPCRVNEEGTDTFINEYSWNDKANMIFLDQPLNVGYSYGKGGASNSVAAAKDVYAFLQLFFKEFPQYADLDFHISGESYAGHYLPAIGGAINRNNKGDFNSPELSQQAKHLVSVNFKSVLIGNGLTDPLIQYKYYAKMACENEYGPVMSESECQKMESKYPTCKKLIQACYDKRNAWACIPASIKCNYDTFIQYEKTGMNPYDVRKKCEVEGGLCYELAGSVQKYMNLPEVKAELGAQREKFSNENGNVNYRFQLAGDWMLPYVDEIAPLLEDNVRILIYAGDADFVCNWMGNKAWTLDLEWSGKEEFVASNDTEWYSERAGRQGGLLRKTTDNRFAFLRVFGAGHMAPYDQPESTLDMLQQWIDGTLE